MNVKPAYLLALLLAMSGLPAMAQTLATVNGKAIPSARADAIHKQMAANGQPDSPQARAMVKDDSITREILVQEAEKKGLGSSPEVKLQIDLARQGILIQALARDFLKKNPVTDAEIKAEYDKWKTAAGDKEYRVRHILVEKEDDAKAIIAKLKAGAKFEDLAKQSSKDQSAANGGDLDWAPPSALVKEFSAAMVSLKNGQYTDTPVKSQHGYHVIKVDDTRAMKPPSLEEVKAGLTDQLQKQKFQAYHADLRSKAKIN